MSHATVRRQVSRFTPEGVRSRRQETLAVEEPLQVLVNRATYATTMRTPGHDLELALGFLVAEGVIGSPEDVAGAMHCPDLATADAPADGDGRGDGRVDGRVDGRGDDDARYNTVTVDLRAHVPAPDPARYRQMSSACGVCGTATVAALRSRCRYDLATDTARWAPALVAGLPEAMRASQRVFERTGGLHAAALFDRAGRLLCLREDVGRHNAVDKVVGWAFTRGLLPLRGHALQVSGRASFELAQKAWLAGIPLLSAVSAPSSMAVELAEEARLTLIGFSRGDRFTVYSGDQRLE